MKKQKEVWKHIEDIEKYAYDAREKECKFEKSTKSDKTTL